MPSPLRNSDVHSEDKIRFEEMPPFGPAADRDVMIGYFESALREWIARGKPEFFRFRIGDEPFHFVKNQDGTCRLLVWDERVWKDDYAPSIFRDSSSFLPMPVPPIHWQLNGGTCQIES